MNALIGIFLIAHGLVHPGLAAAPAENSSKPFTFLTSPGHAWLFTSLGMSEPLIRTIGNALWIAAAVGFVLAGMAWFDILIPAAWLRTLLIGSAAISLSLLLLYWHSWYVVGTLLNLLILAAALLRLGKVA